MRHGTRKFCQGHVPLLLLCASILAGCNAPDVPAATDPHVTEGVDEPETASAATSVDLAGTSWQLVRILSMDDTVDEPDERAKYTISFGADGRAAIRADCNHGSGTWTSDGSSLEFGPLAMTRAMCPPGSLHDAFVMQLGLVRSFLLENGRLHLATMADGSILEFEPVAR